MKLFLFVGILMLCQYVDAQEFWTEQEVEVLNHFGLQPDDPRGIVLWQSSENCTGELHREVRSAIESFFTTSMKKDLTSFCLDEIPDNLSGMPLDIHQIVRLYLAH